MKWALETENYYEKMLQNNYEYDCTLVKPKKNL